MNDVTQSPQSSGSPKPTRRRFLMGTALATLAVATIAGIGARAFAHGGWGGGWHRGGFMGGHLDPAAVDERLDRMLKHFYVEIDATEAQKQQLAPIVKAAVKDLLPLAGQMRDTRRQALELLAQPSIDRGALETLRAEKLRLAEQASRRLTAALADVGDVLTPEQRRTLAEHAQRWHGRPG
jgi:Spy/CpxP family protein refolding chaperone